jgi:sugar phosphate isomerase/epimerase
VSSPEFGIFARVFPTGTVEQVAGWIADAGYTIAQLNLKAVGLPTIPEPGEWAGIDAEPIRSGFAARGISCWGLSCSYNMAHPDAAIRRAGTAAAVELIRHAPPFGVTAVTLCTGSRDPGKMWAFHPDNSSESAWRDMRAELDLLLEAAGEAGVILGIEPEHGNVVRDAEAALRLYAELGPDGARVGIVADSANLLTGLPPETHRDVLERSFTALADRIVCLHAKDLVPWAETLSGRGVIDYGLVGGLYARLELTAPLIVQDVVPEQAAAALGMLRGRFGG